MAKAFARGEVRTGIREPGIAGTWRLRSDKGVAHESRHLDDNQTNRPYVGREHPEEARGAGCGVGQAVSGVKGAFSKKQSSIMQISIEAVCLAFGRENQTLAADLLDRDGRLSIWPPPVRADNGQAGRFLNDGTTQ